MSKLMTAVALGVGYVLGAQAGRQRYEQIADKAKELAARPQVQDLKEKVSGTVQKATGKAGTGTSGDGWTTAGDSAVGAAAGGVGVGAVTLDPLAPPTVDPLVPPVPDPLLPPPSTSPSATLDALDDVGTSAGPLDDPGLPGRP
jgi:outer membrane murein-binding lipoprotein Lpp